MKNNFCEEMNMNDYIKEVHDKSMERMDVPEWMNLPCPFCKKDLPLRSIRNVGLKLNTRNIGDVFVEVFCEDCELMDTMYFRSEVASMKDFLLLLSGKTSPEHFPVIEEEMYKMKYNNLLENMLAGEKDMTITKRAVCSSNVVVSSSVYTCSCGHTEILSPGDTVATMECSKCGNDMVRINTQASKEEPNAGGDYFDAPKIIPNETKDQDD